MRSFRLQRQSGQGLIEYAVVIALVAVVVILVLQLAGVSISDLYQSVVSALGGMGQGVRTLFATNFDEGLGAWSNVNWNRRSSGDWGTQDGLLNTSRFSGMVLDDFNGSDYVVTAYDVDMTRVRDQWQGANLFFRADNSANINGYSFRLQKPGPNSPGRMYISQWANGYQVNPSLAYQELPADFDWEGTYDLSVQVSGDTFTAFLDGEAVLTAQDDTYSEGTVGFFTNSGTEATVNSFEVTELP